LVLINLFGYSLLMADRYLLDGHDQYGHHECLSTSNYYLVI